MKNLWHIGQYFIVESFGVTRMYTCVICMRKQNIEKIKIPKNIPSIFSYEKSGVGGDVLP